MFYSYSCWGGGESNCHCNSILATSVEQSALTLDGNVNYRAATAVHICRSVSNSLNILMGERTNEPPLQFHHGDVFLLFYSNSGGGRQITSRHCSSYWQHHFQHFRQLIIYSLKIRTGNVLIHNTFQITWSHYILVGNLHGNLQLDRNNEGHATGAPLSSFCRDTRRCTSFSVEQLRSIAHYTE
jgi:hypothetical protein